MDFTRFKCCMTKSLTVVWRTDFPYENNKYLNGLVICKAAL